MAIVRTTHRAARVGHDRARGEWADMAGCTGPADARGGPGGSPALPCLTGLAGRAAAGLLLALAVLAAIMPMRAAAQDKDAARAPNIVIVLADDLGYGDVGYLNSQSQIPTPNLDTLAGQGMAFLDAHSPSAVCTPTRYGLLTGRYAWRTRLTRGVLDGYDGPLIAPNRETLGSFLGATGYRTAVIGKWHLGLGFAKNALGEFDFEEPIDDGPHTHGFHESYIIPASLDFPPYVYIRDGEITGFPLGQQSGMEFPRYMRAGELASDFDPADVLDELIRQATGFIQRQASDGSPFLLYLPLTAPHKPVWPAQRFEGTTELGPYGDFIVQVDAAVGDVMSALDQAGVDDNTLLIVTSDNGSFMSRLDGLDDRDHTDDSTIQAYRAGNHTANHVYRGTKADIWEGGHRVPFFARWPGQIEPGSTREEVISLTDVFATVAEIVGKELPNNAAEDSFSLLPLLRGNPWVRPRAAVTHHSIQGMFAIRDGRWKLVAGNGSGGREDPIGQPFERPYQLFDIASDPSEQSNVYDQHPAVAQRLERELERIRSWDRSRMTTDMAVLVALYNGTNGANWKTNTNWLSEAPLVSLWDWHGVTTDENGRVTELALASNDLSGTIPAELGERNLTKLQRLDLSENELSGAIPLTLMTLSQLSVLDIRETTLCAPVNTAFQAWLATIDFQGTVCAAPPPPPPPPAPTITGTAQVGETLTASTTGIADANGLTTPNYTYQWIRVDGTDEADIASANSSTYILVDADLGTTLKVKVTFDDDLGHTETLTSAATATVGAVATAPTVSTVDVTSMPASGDTYGTGEMIQFTVTFDQDVTVTGTPEFEFCLGNSDGGSCTDGSPPPTRRRVALSSGSGTTELVFSYTVVAGDMDDNGIWIGDQDRTIKLDTGDAIRGTVGGLDAVLTHPSGGAQTGHKVNGEATDRAALVALSNATSGPNWTINTNWLTTAALSEWYGVTTDVDGRVTHVYLSQNELNGEIPVELGNLTNLEDLFLNRNELSGPLPLTLSALSQLLVLDIRETTLCAPVNTAFQAWLATIDFKGTVCAPPPPPPPPPGPRQTVPDAPRNLLADATGGAVTLMWEAPEDDGGAVITDYEYRIGQRGDWISIGSTNTTHTVTGLVNGTAYVFQVRALNRIGRSGPSLPAEATPIAQVVLDLAHFANGAGIISEVVLVNVAPHPIRPALYFYDQEGEPIAAESMVDVLGDLGIQEDGGLTIRTEMEPLGELTISTHGRGDLVSGSVKVAAYGTIGGVLRFDIAGIGVAGVQVSQPLRDAIFPVRRREGGIDTGMALHNLREEAAVVSCRLMKNGAVLEEVEISLAANGQVARFIGEVFTGTDTSDFVGLVRCTAEGVAQFTGMALELDAGNRIFTTLPVVKVNRGRAGEAALDFAHFANGASIVSEMVFMNLETQPSGPPLTPFHQAIPPTRPVIYFYDQKGNPIDPALLVDLTEDLEITEDGALSIQSEMEPLGELTISTYGRGELVSGSVRVVSDGPIGGVLRFDLPGIGVAGVGASQPVRDAIFPARRQAGGISTGAAIHNLGEEALVVSCQLMKDGAVLEEEEISLEANGQEARYIEQMFTSTDTSDFVGSVRCIAPEEGMFTGVAVELDADNRIFTTLPVVPVPERMSQE